MQIFEDNFDTPYNKLIDSLFKTKIYLNKFIVASKAIIDARWTNVTKDLEEVKTIERPTK